MMRMTPYRWLLVACMVIGTLYALWMPGPSQVRAATAPTMYQLQHACVYVTDQGGIWGYPGRCQ